MDLSVIINFHNMQREAPRTLFSASRKYQRDIDGIEYEVIAIDNNSSEKIPEKTVSSFGPEFQYYAYETESSSPVAAINEFVAKANGRIIIVLIDGARILSPGIFINVIDSIKNIEQPFVYTIGMHLGPNIQNKSILNGYSKNVEDDLLQQISWQEDGYRLFSISSLALSSRNGFFSNLTESNCFAMYHSTWDRLGGLDRRFQLPGGGLANLEFFNRVVSDPTISPIMLLGEATFHQIHGGTATNVPLDVHPYPQFAAEYEAHIGEPYRPVERKPYYYGAADTYSRKLFYPITDEKQPRSELEAESSVVSDYHSALSRLDDIHRSTSWRITRPLRFMKSLLKNWN